MDREELRNKINKRLTGEERHIANILLDEVLVEMNAYHNKLIEQLSSRLKNEKTAQLNNYEIVMTLCTAQNYNHVSDYLFPMKNDDLYGYGQNFISGIQDENDLTEMDSYFIEEDSMLLSGMDGQRFSGHVNTEEGEVKATFCLVKNETYLHIVSELKRIFIQNRISWSGINDGYLHKFYKLMLYSLDEPLSEKSKILSYKCELENISEKLRRDIFPVWNIKRVEIAANDFPVIQKDQIYYRYDFRVDCNSGWLFAVSSDFDGYFAWYENKVCAFSKNNSLREWNLLQIIRIPDSLKCNYPVLSNGKRKIMWNCMSFDTCKINSEFELRRKVQSYKANDHIEFLRYEITDSIDKQYVVRPDILEYSPKHNRPLMILYFRAGNIPQYLAGDIVDFMVREVQETFGNFTVVGTINTTAI